MGGNRRLEGRQLRCQDAPHHGSAAVAIPELADNFRLFCCPYFPSPFLHRRIPRLLSNSAFFRSLRICWPTALFSNGPFMDHLHCSWNFPELPTRTRQQPVDDKKRYTCLFLFLKKSAHLLLSWLSAISSKGGKESVQQIQNSFAEFRRYSFNNKDEMWLEKR